MICFKLNLIISLIFIAQIVADQQVGDSCTVAADGSSGVCTYVRKCPILTNWAQVSIKPGICSYENRTPIICCPVSSVQSVQSDSNIYNNNDEDDRDREKVYHSNYDNGGASGNSDNRGSIFHSNNDRGPTYTIHTTRRTTIRTEPPIDDDSSFVFPDEDNVAISVNTFSRKSEQKCEEYSRPVTNVIAAIPLVPSPDPVPVSVPKCNSNGLSLIVGGTKAQPKEFPHMAALGYYENGKIAWNCGGTLISDEYVLTAAHCINTPGGSPVKVRLGELNLETDDDGSQPADYTIREIIKHPRYIPPAKYNDIALIRLSRRVKFSDYIRPACLWNKHRINHSRTVATGWGKTDFGGPASPHLLKVSLDIINNEQCRNYYTVDERILPNGIRPTQICSGVLSGGKDTCFGDSGGPITVSSETNSCVYYVIGITSFGKTCAGVNSPGVYTRVSSYVDWIEDTIWP